MAGFNALPLEIQLLILHHIDSTKQLGECRRVKRNWDQLAEEVMFSRPLLITENNVESLHLHLSRKPSNANLITEIHFNCRDLPQITFPLLRLAITPSIKRITTDESNFDLRFYETLAQIARGSGMGLKRLKSIPWPSRFVNTHDQLAFLLKDSLQEITLPENTYFQPHEITMHLGEFRNLSKLQIKCRFDNLPQVESVLRGAGNLKEIDLYAVEFDQAESDQAEVEEAEDEEAEELRQWMEQPRQCMEQRVNINENPISLRANIEYSWSLIEYFLLKYPNIRRFDCEDLGAEEFGYDNDISHICALISKIPNYVLNLSMVPRWWTHFGSFAGDKNVFQLHYGRPRDYEEPPQAHISSIVEQDGKRTTQFQFGVDYILEEHVLDHHVSLLQDFNAFSTRMHMDLIHLRQHIDIAGGSEARVLFKVLEVMNHLEEMKYIGSYCLKPVNLDLPPDYNKRRFKTLEISCVQIQADMFHTLDRFFSTINTLKLSCCPIEKDDTNTVCIYMPSTALGKLILTTELEPTVLPEYQLDLRDMVLLTSDTYLMINLQQGVTLLFKLEPFSNIVHQISAVEYSSRPQDANTFKIDCHLLASIELDLGDIRATIDVKKYCDELDVAFI